MTNPYANTVPRQDDPYLNPDPWSGEENYAPESWEEDWETDYAAEAATDYANQLNQLEVQIQRSPLTPEQQKQELENLAALEGLLENFPGEVPDAVASRIEETQERFIEKLSHLDQWQAAEDLIVNLEQRLAAATTLSPEERDEFVKDLSAARESLNEDPSTEVSELLSPLKETLDKIQTDAEAQVKEAGRGEAIKNRLITSLDMKYAYGQEGLGTEDSQISEYRNINGYPYPVSKKRLKPRSELTHLPQHLQDYDLLMKGESGLQGTRVPSAIVKELYKQNSNVADTLKALKSQLNPLPIGTQALILADVLAVVAESDPEKLDFLKEYQPEVLQYFKSTLAAGNDHIVNGMLVTSGGDHYDVQYLGSQYHIKNQDTAWHRNDWNEFDISIPTVIDPIQTSNRLLEDLLNSTTEVPAT